MSMAKTISICIPVYNESENIGVAIETVEAMFRDQLPGYALEIVVTALLRHMEHDAQQALIQDIEQAIDQVTPCPPVNDHDAMLLQQYLKKLLRHPRS